MKIESIPFQVVDWASLPVTRHPGTNGVATWRTLENGGIRMRMVEYSAGYEADHWCAKGHVVLVLEGELITELQDGRIQVTRAGESYLVADEVAPHRSRTETGVKMFIVD
ncbi:MAG: DHCW motif cupin fold protein [Acidobacteriales bacterium]|nr:DHCW motif cupin fold protein [Terriglobales bacterium]